MFVPRSLSFLPCALPVAATLVVVLPAQGIIDSPNLDMGMAVIPDEPTQEMHLKLAATQAFPLTILSPDGIDFRLDAILDDGTGVRASVRIDAISFGLDSVYAQEIPGTAFAEVDMPFPQQWREMLVSTKDPGVLADSVMDREFGVGSGVKNDVHSEFYEDGWAQLPNGYSTMCPAPRPGDCADRKVFDGDEAMLPSADLCAIDAHMPAYFLDPSVRGALPANPRVYFSLTDASAATAPASWPPFDGATILVRRWTGTAWSPPQIAATATNLLLNPGDEIDGLSVRFDYDAGVDNTHVFYSVDVDAVPAPAILAEVIYAQLDGALDGPLPRGLVLRDRSGEEVGEVYDAAPILVDGICDYDPFVALQTPGAPRLASLWNLVFGTPQPPLLPPAAIKPRLRSSLLRRSILPAALQPEIVATVQLPPGASSSLLGLVHFWILGDLNMFGPALSAPVFAVPVSGKLSTSVLVPPGLPIGVGGSGFAVWSAWVGFDSSGASMQSYMARLQL